MKTYGIILIAILAILLGCKSKANLQATPVTNNEKINSKEVAATTNDTVRIANDELEYEIIIIDPGFNTWLASRAQPRNYYSQNHLESKNRFWVTEWNIRAMQPQRYGDLYLMQIDYRPNINYGYEVNYLLYNYLVYFQINNNQRLGGLVPQF
jgi:hypothetical protein